MWRRCRPTGSRTPIFFTVPTHSPAFPGSACTALPGAGSAFADLRKSAERMARAKLNLDQTQIQIASMERQVSEEVAEVHLTCELCKSELSRSEARALAEAARRRDSAEREYLAPARNGGLPLSRTLETLLSDWHECEKAESRHLEILVRYLINALELNTAVGKRIMP